MRWEEMELDGEDDWVSIVGGSEFEDDEEEGGELMKLR